MVSLYPQQDENVTFSVYTINPGSFNVSCNGNSLIFLVVYLLGRIVSLYNSVGVIVDSRLVGFVVSSLNATCSGNQCASGGGGGSFGNGNPIGILSGCSSCSSLYNVLPLQLEFGLFLTSNVGEYSFDILCILDYSCLQSILEVLAVFVGLLICCCCCCMCCGSKVGRAVLMVLKQAYYEGSKFFLFLGCFQEYLLLHMSAI